MGSSRPRKSTRAGKARSVKPSPPRREPGLPKPPLRSRNTKQADSATCLPAIQRRLRLVRALAYTCAAALRDQSADHDSEVALILQRKIGPEIDHIQLELLSIGVAISKFAEKSGAPLPKELQL